MTAGAADLSGVPPTPLSSGRAAGSTRFGGLVTDGRPTVSYDFLRPSKLAREHMRTLQLIAETFAQKLRLLLTSRLRVVCRVEPTSVEQATVAEHLQQLAEASVVIAPLTLEPLAGTAALELSLATAMTCIDHLLGGSGGPQPERPLSDIELPLLREVLTGALAELRGAFEEVVQIEPQLAMLEYNPQLVPFGGPTDSLVVADFELTVGEATSVLSLCLPLQSLLPELQRHLEQAAVSAGERAARQAARDLLTSRLHEVPVDVTVVFSPIRLLSDQLLDLRPGDVVSLEHPVEVPLDISTAGEVFGRAVATKRGQRLACQVVTATPPSQVSPMIIEEPTV